MNSKFYLNIKFAKILFKRQRRYISLCMRYNSWQYFVKKMKKYLHVVEIFFFFFYTIDNADNRISIQKKRKNKRYLCIYEEI